MGNQPVSYLLHRIGLDWTERSLDWAPDCCPNFADPIARRSIESHLRIRGDRACDSTHLIALLRVPRKVLTARLLKGLRCMRLGRRCSPPHRLYLIPSCMPSKLLPLLLLLVYCWYLCSHSYSRPLRIPRILPSILRPFFLFLASSLSHCGNPSHRLV